MISKINKLVLFIAIVGISAYIFYLNPGTTTVNLGGAAPFAASTALVLVITFILGMIFTALFAFYFGIKSYFRERRHQNLHRRRELLDKLILEARGYQAIQDWDKARELWKRILSYEPDHTIALIESSRALESNGEAKEALRVIEQARIKFPENPEILLRAAEISCAVGNRTSALDNLALIMQKQPTSRAAKLARDLAEELEKYDEALGYHEQLVRLGDQSNSPGEIVDRIEYKKIMAGHKEKPLELKEALGDFIKSHRMYVPPLYRLAQIHIAAGNFDEAAKLLLRAAKVSLHSFYWREAAELWIKQKQPERALSTARAGVSETSGIERIRAELELIKIYLLLNMSDQAKKAIESFDALVVSEKVKPSNELGELFLLLKGRTLIALGDYREAAMVLQQLTDAELSHAWRNEGIVTVDAPSPTLSTP